MVEIELSPLTLSVGETIQLSLVVKDAGGNILPDAQVLFFSGNRVSLGVTPTGFVEAFQPGDQSLLL